MASAALGDNRATLCGKCGTDGNGLAQVALLGWWPPRDFVWQAGVALGDIDITQGRCGTLTRRLCVAGLPWHACASQDFAW